MARLDRPIAELARQFVLVRLTSMRGVDLSRFDFDYDLTWMAFFLGPDETVLGRFGGRDPDDAEKYARLEGLRHALEAALAAQRHRLLAPALPVPRARQPDTVDQLPAAQRLRAGACIHCHHVYDFRRQARQSAGLWRKDELWVYPMPENLGLSLSPERGNEVRAVTPGSAADRAGLRAGDLLGRINDLPAASFADVQYALHRAPASGAISVHWQRQGRTRTAMLELPEGWRKTDLSWRWSLRGVEPVPPVSGEDLTADEKRQLGLAEKRLAFRPGPFLSAAARQAGIQPNDVVIGLDGQALEMTARQFAAHVRLNYEVGQRVRINVIREGQRLDLPLLLAARPPI